MDLNNLGINSLGKKEFGISSQAAASSKSVSFDGTNGYMNMPNSGGGFPLHGNTAFSIVSYVKIASTNSSDKYLFSQRSSSSIAPAYAIQTGPTNINRIRLWVRDDGSSTRILQETAGQVWPLDTWFHFAWIDNNGVVSCYVDNVEKLSGALNYTRGTLTLDRNTFGASVYTSVGNYLNSKMKNAKIYNVALTSGNVATLFGGGDVAGGKICELNMNDNVLDISGNGNNATLSASGATYSTDIP